MELNLVQILVKKTSERVPQKNTRLFAGTTLIEIAIEKAMKIFPKEHIYINSNCELAKELSRKYRINFYHRKESLCQNSITLDEISYDFMKAIPSKQLTLINTVNPLLKAETIQKLIQHFKNKKDTDSIISGNKHNLHTFMNKKAINFENIGSIPQTQDLKSIETCNWGAAIWNCSQFIKNFEHNKRAVFCDNFQFFDTPPLESTKISTEKDFYEAEKLFKILVGV